MKQRKTIYSLLILVFLFTTLLQGSLVQSTEIPQDQFRESGSWVKYKVEYSFNYTSLSFPNSFSTWLFRINNLTSDVDPDIPNSQLSILKKMVVLGADNQSLDLSDIYGNSIYYFEREFKFGQSNQTFSVYYEYEVTLFQTEWNYNNTNIGTIGPSLPEYTYTAAKPYIESDDPVIIAKSNEITQGLTDIDEKVKVIFEWVSDYLNYTLLDRAIGAKEALNDGEGDCSEFSSLTVALLKAQGIPARKVVGLVMIDPDSEENIPLYYPEIGKTFSYEQLPGHAWIQYYLPNIGWVTADPTWASGSGYKTTGYGDFFDEIDYIHLTLGVGDYYGDGIDPELFYDATKPWIYQEMGLGPFFVHQTNNFDYEFDYTFTILDFDLPEQSNKTLQTYAILGIMASLVVGSMVYAFKPKKRSEPNYY